MSIFSDEWRACLREQYKYVVRNNDARTLETLTEVLHSVGFGDDELRELTVQATIRTEDMPEDFQPDLDILESPGFPAAVIEETLAEDDDAEAPLTVEDMLALEAEIEAEEAIDMDAETEVVSVADADSAGDFVAEGDFAAEVDANDRPDADTPIQLSLFD